MKTIETIFSRVSNSTSVEQLKDLLRLIRQARISNDSPRLQVIANQVCEMIERKAA